MKELLPIFIAILTTTTITMVIYLRERKDWQSMDRVQQRRYLMLSMFGVGLFLLLWIILRYFL